MKKPTNSRKTTLVTRNLNRRLIKANGFFSNMFSSFKRLPGIKHTLNFLDKRKQNAAFKDYYTNEKNKMVDAFKQRRLLTEIKPENINLATSAETAPQPDSRFSIDLNWAKERGYQPPKFLSNADWKYKLNRGQMFARKQGLSPASALMGKGLMRKTFKYPF